MSDLVTVKIAEKLKEKGFPQHICDTGYIIENDKKNRYNTGDKEVVWKIPKGLSYVAAPTISQVFKWLREEKKLHVHPEPAYFSKVGLWEIYIVNINDYVQCSTNKEYNSYEEAALEGIEYLLNNLI